MHYGHSCLVPIDSCVVPVLYVFVDISINTDHLVQSLKHAFARETKLLLVSTVQFIASLHNAREALAAHFEQVTRLVHCCRIFRERTIHASQRVVRRAGRVQSRAWPEPRQGGRVFEGPGLIPGARTTLVIPGVRYTASLLRGRLCHPRRAVTFARVRSDALFVWELSRCVACRFNFHRRGLSLRARYASAFPKSPLATFFRPL